ncbi:hypothetical protein CVT26_000224 [Gymnopilus dilepis]|uniref:Uncharacterized protein n=1 Tax=Gymnopilus dilepis TaxID=231916 RepID=A0A409VG86_9AGAR|nr:hypothetical protein CVT26_000224 [Gymnopilus dilepis]
MNHAVAPKHSTTFESHHGAGQRAFLFLLHREFKDDIYLLRSTSRQFQYRRSAMLFRRIDWLKHENCTWAVGEFEQIRVEVRPQQVLAFPYGPKRFEKSWSPKERGTGVNGFHTTVRRRNKHVRSDLKSRKESEHSSLESALKLANPQQELAGTIQRGHLIVQGGAIGQPTKHASQVISRGQGEVEEFQSLPVTFGAYHGTRD